MRSRTNRIFAVMDEQRYVHGYSERESERLYDQASTLARLLHHDTRYPAGSRVLEAGCGIGAQTRILAKNSPGALFTSIDISEKSLRAARASLESERITNVSFQQADIFSLPFPDAYFDHIFICFVLEHLTAPLDALICLKRVLKAGGTITAIEGDHGSCYFHPETRESRAAWHSLIDAQDRLSGNSLIGRQIYPLLTSAGYSGVRVSPRMVYIDASEPDLQEGFVRRTIIPMVEGVREQAIALRLIDPLTFERGIHDLHETAQIQGTFCYTFFKGVGVR